MEWQFVSLGEDAIDLVAKAFSRSVVVNAKGVLVLILDIPHFEYTLPYIGDEPPDPIIGSGSYTIRVLAVSRRRCANLSPHF